MCSSWYSVQLQFLYFLGQEVQTMTFYNIKYYHLNNPLSHPSRCESAAHCHRTLNLATLFLTHQMYTLTHASTSITCRGKTRGWGVERINLNKNSLNMKLHESCRYVSWFLLYGCYYVENTEVTQIWKHRTQGTITSHKILRSLNKMNTFCERWVRFRALSTQYPLLKCLYWESPLNPGGWNSFWLLVQHEDAMEPPLKNRSLFT